MARCPYCGEAMLSERPHRSVRARIVTADGKPIAPGLVTATPEVSLPHIGKLGWAERRGETYRIALDDGTVLWGYDCWWEEASRG